MATILNPFTQQLAKRRSTFPQSVVEEQLNRSPEVVAAERLLNSPLANDPNAASPLANPPSTVELAQQIVGAQAKRPAIPRHSPQDVARRVQQAVSGFAPVRSRLNSQIAQVERENRAISERFQDNTNLMVDAALAQGNIQKAEARAQADVISETQKLQLGLENQKRRAEELRQEELEAQTTKIKEAIDDVNSFKLDPDRLNRGTNRAISTIAIALGQLGSQLAGGPNTAMQIINSKIDRDLLAQRTELENRRGNVGAQTNMLSVMRARFEDDRDAEDAARIAMLEQQRLEAEKIAANSRSEQATVNAQGVAANLKNEQLSVQERMNTRAEDRAFKKAGLEAQLVGAESAAAASRASAAAAPQGQVLGLTRIPNAPPPTKDDVKEAKKVLGKVNPVISSLQNLIALRSEFGAERINPQIRAQMQADASAVKVGIGALFDLGALSESDLEIIKGIAPDDPAAIGFVLPKLEAALNSTNRILRGKLQPLGFEMDLTERGEAL